VTDDKRYEVHVRSHLDEGYRHILGEGGVSATRAERIEEGILINMDREHYYTEIVEVKD
jgi:hypothetical protein